MYIIYIYIYYIYIYIYNIYIYIHTYIHTHNCMIFVYNAFIITIPDRPTIITFLYHLKSVFLITHESLSDTIPLMIYSSATQSMYNQWTMWQTPNDIYPMQVYVGHVNLCIIHTTLAVLIQLGNY